MRDLIYLIGWRNIGKGIVEGLVVTAYLSAVYLGACELIPFR